MHIEDVYLILKLAPIPSPLCFVIIAAMYLSFLKPIRALRVHDENAVSANPHNKTIHSRNKSSPALSTLASIGAVKLPAKRTAFGDVSNTVRGNQTVRDISALSNKPQQVQPQVDKKTTAALQQPAQRPTSLVTGFKEPGKNILAPSRTQAEPTVSSTSLAQKTLSKKNTTVFKDYSTISKPLDDNLIVQKAAVPRESLLPLDKNVPPNVNSSITSSKVDEPEKVRKTKSIQSIKASKVEPIVQPPVVHQTTSTRLSANSLKDGKVEAQVSIVDASMQASKHQSLSLRKTPLPSSLSVETSNKASTKTVSGKTEVALAKKGLQPGSEPEEYCDGDYDEEAENYEDDGYVTARSFRSKADNLTGNITTTIVPRFSNKVDKELDAAAAIVTLSRPMIELEDEAWDVTMVSEYKEEIFEYYRELEVNFFSCLGGVKLILNRLKWPRILIIWTARRRSNGRCVQSLWIGLFRFIIASSFSLKRCSSVPT